MRWFGMACAVVMAAALSGCNSLMGASDSGGAGLWGTAFGSSAKSVAEAEASAAITKLLEGNQGLVLEPSDRRVAAEAQRQALAAPGTGGAVRWDNPKTGRSGEVRPGPRYQVNRTECREFTHEVVAKGAAPVAVRATACMDGGTWRTIS
ncbi:LipA a lipoprotein [Polymorphum gilvum]|uniref:LipA a lipoprotein n=1 Tax=Polymorphum gilvum (strain LMG 25793 / CGMCC 1.9160 / SL003B-26A1) TaxID=991905 RepID=F2J6G0_POLGS|nr:LipA a lipoprotein [Polymorphum gilvum]ADZ71334.1 LipA a lipoprotein [Polymorphum gilvum SL003B-26A1]